MVKAIYGNLDLRRVYEFVSLDTVDDGFVCDNCGKPLKKVVTLKDDLGCTHDVGIDCAEGLMEVCKGFSNGLHMLQAKKELARKERFLRFLKKDLIKAELNKYGIYWLYAKNKQGKIDWKYRVNGNHINDIEKTLILAKLVKAEV